MCERTSFILRTWDMRSKNICKVILTLMGDLRFLHENGAYFISQVNLP